MTIAYKKAALYAGSFALVAASGFLATQAFFSDSETSKDNVFAAGSLDLEVGSSNRDGGPFGPADLDENQHLFAFEDLMPGDMQVEYFSFRSSQDAWLCAAADITATEEQGVTDGEELSDSTEGDDEGELQDYIEIAIWEANNGNSDGIIGTEEVDTLQILPLTEFADGTYRVLQDSAMGDNPLVADEEYAHEFAYCVGEFSFATSTRKLTCDGGISGINAAQTDVVKGTIHFYAEQRKNNDAFLCSLLNATTTESVFVLDEEHSPGLDDNNPDEPVPGALQYDQPYITWEIGGSEIALTFHNPTPWLYIFDYRIDGEDGTDRPDDLSGETIAGGPLEGQQFGHTYNRVPLNGTGSTTVEVTGDDLIEVGLREGAENLGYIDWIRFAKD